MQPDPFVLDEEPHHNALNVVTKLKAIQDKFDTFITSVQENPSRLSKMSLYWGSSSLWKKVLLGVLAFGSILAIGIYIHFVPLIVIAGLSVLIYAGIGLLLDEHYGVNKGPREEIKQDLKALSEMVIEIISELAENNKQYKELNLDHEKLNQQQGLKIVELTEIITSLSGTLQRLIIDEETRKQFSQSFKQNLERLEALETSKFQNAEQLLEKLLNLFTVSNQREKNLEDQINHLQEVVIQLEKTNTEYKENHKALLSRFEGDVDKLEELLDKPGNSLSFFKLSPPGSINSHLIVPGVSNMVI